MAEKKIILVVDDMAENLTLIRSMLEKAYDVRLAKSAKMAMALLGTTKVDLILLDIEMPGISGFEFLRQLNDRLSNSKDTPVIFVTSHADRELINQAINSGARDYILKPVKADALHKKIDAVIGTPQSKGSLEEKLNALMAACITGDSARVENLTRELLGMTALQSKQARYSMEDIAKLIHAFEYEKGIIKIKELLHNISLNRKW